MMRLYAHWPFCLSRCSYCDFNSRVAGRPLMDEYRRALLAEADAWARVLAYRSGPLLSLYLGGGTPSTLSGEGVAELVAGLSRGFGLAPGAETTVEVNPATWCEADFAAARAGGVNRFSIGVQSLDEEALRLLGRIHGAGQARDAVRAALAAGAAVSVDLLYGLPETGKGGVEHTLFETLALRPHHVSLYALTLEESVPLARKAARGEVSLPDEDACAEEYLACVRILEESGYLQYEISNFCLPGFHSRHNQAYWRREEYLGLGAGAHSLVCGIRFRNQTSLLRYVRDICGGRPAVAAWETLTPGEEREEEIMLGLRTADGVAAALLEGKELFLAEMEEVGLLRRRAGRVALTARGMLVSNAVIGALLAA